jgi:hypothetical protein
VVALTLIGVSAVVAAYCVFIILTRSQLPPGFDFAIYHDGAARWLAGGPFYDPAQMAPYEVIAGSVLYPPVALVLFVPFVFLPGVLWWAIPIGIVAWHVCRMRPGLWGWVGISLCLADPQTIQLIQAGNPVMWIAAAFALSFRWPWVGVFVLLKPSLFPFALGGIRTREWWVALGVLALVSLVFLPMWVDWVRVVLNARGPLSGLLYSLKDVPMMLIPLIAWWARPSSHECASGDYCPNHPRQPAR